MSDPLPPTVRVVGGIPPTITTGPDFPQFGPPIVPGELGVLAGYRVQKLLGMGGMGVVYLALDDGLRRQVALKVMLPKYAADADSNYRFRREARAVAAVRHDNVVTVYQVGEDGGTPFLAMELLQGYPLDDYLKKKGRLSVPQALRVGTETALGLAAAHALNLIHRDIKPANLWLEAPQGRIKILDFGLAKPLSEPGEGTDLTNAGAVMGTPAYMSPEQTRGEPADARSDLWSLGVVLYQLTTGKRPFDRATGMATAVAIATEPPTPVQALNPDVPEPVARLIHALLEKDPAARPQTAAEVARMLRDLERGATISLPDRDLSVTTAPPQIVYVPIQVTAIDPGASEFADLDRDDPTTLDDSTNGPAAAPVPPPRPPARFPWAAAVVAAALIVIGGTAMYFAFKRKAPEAKKGDDTPVAQPQTTVTPPVPTPKPTLQREFAKWVFEKRGTVLVNGTEVKKDADLTDPQPNITGVSFTATLYEPTDEDVKRFAVCPDITVLRFYNVAFTPVGFKALLDLSFGPNLQSLGISIPRHPEALAQLTKCKSLYTLQVARMPLSDRLAFLSEIPSLRNFITFDSDVTNKDLAALKDTPLSGLAVTGLKQITPAGLEQLAAARNSLVELNITRSGVRGREGAETVAKFSKIHTLTADGLDWKDDDITPLQKLTGLQHIQLNDNPLSDRVLEFIRDVPKPATLSLRNTNVTDAGLKLLYDKKSLSEIHLEGTKVTLEGVKDLQDALPRVPITFSYKADEDPDRKLAVWLIGKGGSVNLTGDPVSVNAVENLPAGPLRVNTAYGPAPSKPPIVMTDDDLDRFRGTRVNHYSMGSTHAFTDAGFEKFCNFPRANRITVLSLASPKVTDKGYKHLAKLKSMWGLHLDHTKVSDDALAVCRELPKLTEVNLWLTPITDKGLVHLEGLSLTHLLVHQTTVGDEGLKIIGRMGTLEKLILNRTKVTNDGLAHLTGLKKLAWLDLSVTSVSDAGMEHVAKLPALVKLDLGGASMIGNPGLKHLERISTLEVIDVLNTKVTEPAKEAFLKARRGCRFDRVR